MSGSVQIMDAAEKRMRSGGFSGFSFREIAEDVGVKSSTVHYYFPTKENLAAAVVRRYKKDVAEFFDRELESEPDPIKAWTRAYRTTMTEERMCPCVVLAAAALVLPKEVTAEIQDFYNMCLGKLTEHGMASNVAAEFLATLTGAMVIANAFGDIGYFDKATAEILKDAGAKTKSIRTPTTFRTDRQRKHS